MAEDPAAAMVDQALAMFGPEIEAMPAEIRPALLRLVGVVASHGDDLPDALEEAIAAISVFGVDPHWQLAELEKILDRWARRQ